MEENSVAFLSDSSYFMGDLGFIKSEPIDEDDVFLSEALSGIDRVVPEITEVSAIKSEPFWDSSPFSNAFYSNVQSDYGRNSNHQEFVLSDGRNSSYQEFDLSDGYNYSCFDTVTNETVISETAGDPFLTELKASNYNQFSSCSCAHHRHRNGTSQKGRLGFRNTIPLSQEHSYSSLVGHTPLPSIASVFENSAPTTVHFQRPARRQKSSPKSRDPPYYSSNFHRNSSRNSKTTMTDVLMPGDTFGVMSGKSDAGPVRKKREKKRGGSSPYTTVPLPPCKICGGNATGFHFGVITCEACKAFFRRALIHKQEYKCVKNDDCEIIDKKLGNCSACRLKKCFAVGMSKGGVRRGRYSIAIRTKAIVEAKAMAGKEAVAMVPTREPEESKTNIPMYMSPSSSSGSDTFDGLLEISDLDEDLGLTVTVHPTRQPEFVYNSELEFLIDALVSCQDAVYPNLKKHFDPTVEEFQLKVWEENLVKKEVFDDLFGQSAAISTEEFQQIFAETGIDLDDRLQLFNQKGHSMEESIAQFVNYAKIIPGFKHFNPKDVSRLLKASHMEFWLLGNYMILNNKLGVTGLPYSDSFGSTKEQMYKFFDNEYVDELLQFAESLRMMSLSLEEIALLRVIALTYTDRCSLVEADKIDTLQNKYVECLQYYLEKTKPEPARRLFQLFDRLLAVRDLSHSNVRVNRKFLQDWSFLMTEYPLWKEMLSYDEL